MCFCNFLLKISVVFFCIQAEASSHACYPTLQSNKQERRSQETIPFKALLCCELKWRCSIKPNSVQNVFQKALTLDEYDETTAVLDKLIQTFSIQNIFIS